MKSFKFLLVAVILAAIAVTGCKKEAVVYKPVPAGEIRIGVLLALTGTGFSSGQSSKVALELARQDILEYFATIGNQDQITLLMADTKTDTAEALNQLRGLYGKGIRVVIGPYSSAELAHIKGFADTHGMLMLSPSSVSVSLAIPDDNVFRFVTSDVIQGEAMNKMLVEDKIKVIIPMVRDDLWGLDLLAATRKNFMAVGGQVHDPVKFDPATTDFSDALALLDAEVATELNHHNPNEVAVYMLSFAEGDKILANANKYLNLNNVYWYGGSAFAQNASMLGDSNAALFAYSHGFPCPVFGLDDAAKSRWQPLVERIRTQIGRAPDVYAITAYDALWVLVRSCLAAGNNPSITLLKNVFVNEADNFFGASGNTQLDVNGDRAAGNYDFWAVKADSAGYGWKRVARYNSLNGILSRLVE